MPTSGSSKKRGGGDLNLTNLKNSFVSEHQPLRGLTANQRNMIVKSTSSKIALGMDPAKRNAWYKDAIRESDGYRMNALISDLASRRGAYDIAEKKNGENPQVKSKSVVPRGGNWRNNFDIRWTS